jgi:hypothetical protein
LQAPQGPYTNVLDLQVFQEALRITSGVQQHRGVIHGCTCFSTRVPHYGEDN